MKRFDQPEDYSRDWARGVCMSVEKMTGVQARPARAWPFWLVGSIYVVGVLFIVGFAMTGGT